MRTLVLWHNENGALCGLLMTHPEEADLMRVASEAGVADGKPIFIQTRQDVVLEELSVLDEGHDEIDIYHMSMPE